MTKAQAKKLDKAIESVWYRHFSGVQIPILDINPLFAYARQLIIEKKATTETQLVEALRHYCAARHYTKSDV